MLNIATQRVRDRSGNVAVAIAKKVLDEEATQPLHAETPQTYTFCNGRATLERRARPNAQKIKLKLRGD